MEKKDFIRTESFTLKLRSSGAKKLVKEINNQFYIRKAEYEKGMCSWAYIIQCKATELSQYLSSKKTQLDFTKPVPNLNRIDDYELREKIMAVPYSEWKKTGYSKGTLHYLKSHVKENKPFKVYKQVMEKLATIG
jgi:CRISPR-associated protein Cas1